MKTRFSFLLTFVFLFIGCEKPLREFTILSNDKTEKLKVYSDSTFILNSGDNKYSGKWKGIIGDDEIFLITPTMNNSKTMTLTPTEYFTIKNSTLVRIKKDALQKGWKLYEFIDFNHIDKIKVRNKNGIHYLTKEQSELIKSKIKNSKSVGGLICKPQWLALTFEFKNGYTIEGSICGSLINFENRKLEGSFRMNEILNLNEY